MQRTGRGHQFCTGEEGWVRPPTSQRPQILPKSYHLFPFQMDHQEYSEITLCLSGPTRLNKSTQHQPGCKPPLWFMHGETESQRSPLCSRASWGAEQGAADLPGIPEVHDAEPGQINPAGERRCQLGLSTLGEGRAVHFWGRLRAESA